MTDDLKATEEEIDVVEDLSQMVMGMGQNEALFLFATMQFMLAINEIGAESAKPGQDLDQLRELVKAHITNYGGDIKAFLITTVPHLLTEENHAEAQATPKES